MKTVSNINIILLETLKACVIDAKQNLTKKERLERIQSAEKVIAEAENYEENSLLTLSR